MKNEYQFYLRHSDNKNLPILIYDIGVFFLINILRYNLFVIEDKKYQFDIKKVAEKMVKNEVEAAKKVMEWNKKQGKRN